MLPSVRAVNPHPAIRALPVAATVGDDAYFALDPVRILDTRLSGQSLNSGQSLDLDVVGTFQGEVVPADATAVVLNITVTNTSTPGFLTVYPAGESLPEVSNVNWSSGETRANLGIIPIGPDHQIAIYNDLGHTDVVLDLQGYFAPAAPGSTAGAYAPLPPARIADTRAGSGEPYAGDTLPPGGYLSIQVGGAGGVPATGVEAAVMNLTITNTTSPGFLQLYPQGEAQPLSSSVNWTGTGQTVANRVVVPLGPTGEVTVFNPVGDVDLVLDVNGWFASASGTMTDPSFFTPIDPTRILDTRLEGPQIGAGVSMTEPMTGGPAGVPTTASAVVTNVTTTDTAGPGYLGLYPGPETLDSDLNWFAAGQTQANLDLVTLSSADTTTAYDAGGQADLVLDVSGYFTPATRATPTGYACGAGTVTTDISSDVIGDPVEATLSGVSCPLGTPSYNFLYQVSGSSAWTSASGWVGASSYIFDTYGWAAGNYNLMVQDSNAPQIGSQQQASIAMPLASGGGFVVSNVTYHYQVYTEDCEEAALQMALSHEGINVAQGGGSAPDYGAAGTILGAEGVEYPPSGIGGPTGDPDRYFVGEPNLPLGADTHGLEPGTYSPPVARAAADFGGDVLAAGQGIDPGELFTYVEQGHPAVVWVTASWRPHASTTICAEGDCFLWAGADEHSVTVVGIGANSVLIDNPLLTSIYGDPYLGPDAWVPMSVFDSVYATYGDMAVVLK